MGVQELKIYDSEASYSYHLRAPDRRQPELRLDADDIHPWFAIHLLDPAAAANDNPDDTGAGYAFIPQARLEYMAATVGFDADEVPVIVDTLLHLPSWDASDPLAMLDRKVRKAQEALDRLPDPRNANLGRKKRRQAMIDHASVVKERIRLTEAAPREDRQFMLDWRAAAIRDWETRLAEVGEELPWPYQLGRDEQAPEDPLAVIVEGGGLDRRRIAARIARDEWLSIQADNAAKRDLAAAKAPLTFAFHRMMPDVAQLAEMVEEGRAEMSKARERGSRALEEVRRRREASTS